MYFDLQSARFILISYNCVYFTCDCKSLLKWFFKEVKVKVRYLS